MNKLMQQKHLKKLTGNLGKVEIKDDRIICYVDERKLEKFKCKHTDIYNLVLMQKLFYKPLKQQKYDLEKPIYYIFEYIDFDKIGLRIESCEGTHFIFRYCDFYERIDVCWADSITLEENQYFLHELENNYCCFMGKINNLKIIYNGFYLKPGLEFSYLWELEVENLEIKNSDISLLDSKGFFKIEANNIDIIDSNIGVNQKINFKANNINLINSEIKSNEEIIIDNENGKNSNNLPMGLSAPKIIYNGIDLAHININPNSIGMKNLRTIFINQLKLLKENVRKEQEEKLSIINKRFENQSINNFIKSK